MDRAEGEACDAPSGVTADGIPCGKPNDPNPCQFVADSDGNCDPGLHKGLDDGCYAASAVFGDAGDSRGELLQLRKNSDGSVVAVYRNGPDLTLATLDSAGGIASSESLLGAAEGLAAPVEASVTSSDLRPRADAVEPLSGNHMILPVRSRNASGAETANAVNYLREQNDVFLTQIQTSAKTAADFPSVETARAPRLVPIPAEAGTNLADVAYFSHNGTNVSICFRAGDGFECDSKLPAGPDFKLVAGAVAPFSIVSHPTLMAERWLKSSVVPFGLTVPATLPETPKLLGIAADAPVPPATRPTVELFDFSTKTIAPGCDPEKCYPLPDCCGGQSDACTKFCVFGGEPDGPCDCSDDCWASCRVEPQAVDPGCPAECLQTIEPLEILFTAAGPSTLHGSTLGFFVRFRFNEKQFIGLFVAHHSGLSNCADLETACDHKAAFLTSMSADFVFPLPEDVDLGALNSIQQGDVTGDGIEDYATNENPPRIILSYPTQVATLMSVDRVLGAEDVTGDGLADLVCSKNDRIVVLLGGPTVPFAEFSFNVTAPGSSAQAKEVVFADLDGDGVKDAVIRTVGSDDCTNDDGQILVLYGGSKLESPIPVGAGACIDQMLPSHLVFQRDGVEDVAFFRSNCPIPGEACDGSLGALFGDLNRQLTSPFSLGGTIQKILPLAGTNADAEDLALVFLDKDGATEAVRLKVGANQVTQEPTSVTLGPGGQLVRTETGNLAGWDDDGLRIYGASTLALLPDTPTAPALAENDVKHLLAVPTQSAAISAVGGFVLVKQSAGRVTVGLAYEGEKGWDLQLVTDVTCTGSGVTEPFWLSQTEFVACNNIFTINPALAPAQYCAATPSDLGSRYFSEDLDGDGLFERVERAFGAVSKQENVCEAGAVEVGTR